MSADNYPEFNQAVQTLTDEVEALITNVGSLQSVANIQTAVTKAGEASDSATAASASEQAAEQAATQAAASQTAAASSQTAAAASEQAAGESAAQAQAASSAASASAGEASADAAAALQAKLDAEVQAMAAAGSASQASTDADSAAQSASSAASSATSAESSAQSAATSATQASGSASASASSAGQASTSASEAAQSAAQASASASTATTKASQASASASTATTKASQALASATQAAQSASAAGDSESAAALSANQAASSATAAQTSAVIAEDAETAASASATSASADAASASSSKTAAAASAAAASSAAAEASDSADSASASATSADASKTAAANSAASAASDAASASSDAQTASAAAAQTQQDLTAVTAAKDTVLATASQVSDDADAAALARDQAVQAAATAAGGLVDMGGVSLAGGTYPTKPTASSFWKVTAGGTVGGVEYGVGDTLVYSLQLDEFYKIDSTESVTSVNGKKGVISLGYAEVGALGAGQTAVAAAKLATSRTISITGDGSWSVSFDGSGNATGAFSLSNTGVAGGTYAKVTVDSKGRVTAGSALAASDIPALDASKVTSGTLAAARVPTLAVSKVSGLQTALDLASGLSASGSTSDPNTATTQVMLTNHANAPGLGRYWHITTTFYSSISSTGDRAQLAIEYNPSGICRAFVRSCYNTNWTAWNPIDNTSLTASDIPALDAAKIATGVLDAARIPTLNQDTTGNAATATKLASIGTSFSGTYPMVINASGVLYSHANVTFTGTGGVLSAPKFSGDGALLTGLNASALATGTIDAARIPTLNQNTTGSAAKLTTARTITLTGDGSWSVSFDGSGNATGAFALDTTGVSAGTYPKVTVDAKGRVTGGAALSASDIPSLDASKIASGTLNAARIPTLNQNTTGSAGALARKDTRSQDPTPGEYENDGVTYHFKYNSATGFTSGGGTYHRLLNLDAWTGTSGGLSSQMAFGDNGTVGIRTATSDTVWGPWHTFYTTANKPTADDVGLGNVDNTADNAKSVLSAAKLTTARTINGSSFNGTANITTSLWGATRTLSYTGDVTGSASVNGSGNVEFTMTLPNTGVSAGTYAKVTVDAKGRVTGGTALAAGDLPSHNHSASNITSGVLDPARLPAEALVGDTTYSAGVGLSLSGTIFSIAPATADNPGGVRLGSDVEQAVAPVAVTSSASRTYAVQMNADQRLVVNVPWTNTTYSEISEAEITTGTASTARAISARRLTFALAGKANASHTHDYLPLAGGTVTGNVVLSSATASTSPTTGALKVTGGVGVGGAIYAAGNIGGLSDIRVKTNIEVIENALDKVDQLRGVVFDRTDISLRQTGVIAQEVQAVLPEAVSDDGEHLTVAYGNMVGLLIEAVKELRAEVNRLKGGA
jgi:phage-related tail fiber protein